jgi:nitrite reductase (NADH) small subunit
MTVGGDEPATGVGSVAQPISKWIDVGSIDAIPIRGARVVRTAAGCIAVFRTATNEAFAIDDACPHKAGPLSQGIVHDKAVTCPLHNWVIDLESGAARGADKGKVFTFPLKIDGGRILLDGEAIAARWA